MINEKMLALGTKRSVIREIFEYGKKRKSEIGADNVFDFSLGNPSVPAPAEVNEALCRLISSTPAEVLHGYTSAQGDARVRGAIAEYINNTHGVCESADKIFLTVGAAASLTVSLNALLNQGEEVMALVPFFPEYRVFVEKAGGRLVTVNYREEDFQPDIAHFEASITPRTRAVIVNSPNNPTGAVLTEETIKEIARILTEKSREYGEDIYIISDEPYRELVYDKETYVPYIPKYYGNTIVSYSFSKSLSLPGERIGYILVPAACNNADEIYGAVCGSARALGFVCAPSLFQYLIPEVIGKTSDISIYKKNRDILYGALTSYGYKAVKPDGAFYLFVKAPFGNAKELCERAKKHELLLVPGDDFGCPEYVRISYCVSTEQIERSLGAFKNLIDEYEA